MIDLKYISNLESFDLVGKLFARKNRFIPEIVFIYFENTDGEVFKGSDGLIYYMDGSCSNITFEIVFEVKNYGRLQ